MRLVLAAIVALAIPSPADACIRAGEANTLVGWPADGKYALYELVQGKTIDHAEILPTTYSGFIYTITANDDEIVVARVKVGSCAAFGEDDKAVVEKKHGKLTDKT